MRHTIDNPPSAIRPGRVLAAVALIALAVVAAYRAWLDMALIGWEDPEQSQVMLALPAVLLLLLSRRDRLSRVTQRSSVLGVLCVAAGMAMSWFGYTHAVQSVWHLGAVLMVVGAAWSVFGSRAVLIALPAVLAMAALVPVPNLIRLDIALPLQRITAVSSEFVLVAMGLDVERVGQTLLYKGMPAKIEEACNGMRMILALALVCYTFVMVHRLSAFARLILLALSPALAVGCNIVRVVLTVVVYGEFDQTTGDMFHDLAGWAMIVIAALLLQGLLWVLAWAEVPLYAPPTPPALLPKPEARRPGRFATTCAPLACALVLAAATAYSLSLPGAADAAPYHRAVVLASDNTPIQVEGLEARPLEIPKGSLEILRANIDRAVQYTDPQAGITGQFLLIQSKDARDLDGHYPPRCYTNVYGYVELRDLRTDRAWQADGLTMHGTEYTFAESDKPNARRWVVLHCFVLPEHGTTGQWQTMRQAAADYLRRHDGAAQVQLKFDAANTTPALRDAMFVRVLNAHADLLRVILAGPTLTASRN